MEIKLFSGSSHPVFAQEVASSLGMNLDETISKTFSCGERYVKFGSTCRGQEVFIFQTGRTGNMNEDLIELLLMISTAKQSFADHVTVVMPYYPYSRQDKIHDPREGISAKLFADLIVKAGADHMITFHLHSDQIQGFFDCPVDNLNPRRILAQYIKDKNITDGVIVSPDAGGAKDAKKFADLLGMPLAIMHKQRPEHNVSEVTHVIGDVKGKTPILVDDMVDTAGSVTQAKKALQEKGANDEAYLVTTHPIFSGPAVDRLTAANFTEIITTNTLPVDTPPKNHHVISVAPLVAEVIRNVVKGESVSQLHL